MTSSVAGLKIGAIDAPAHTLAARRRVLGRWRPGLFVVAIWSLLVILVALVFLLAIGVGQGWPSIAVAFVGAALAHSFFRACTKFANDRLLQRWLDRGVPRTTEWMLAMDDVGLRLNSELGDMTIRWLAVHEVFLSEDDWIVLYYWNVFGIPRRAFPSAEEERAFMGNLLERLRPAARARSRPAEVQIGIANEAPIRP